MTRPLLRFCALALIGATAAVSATAHDATPVDHGHPVQAAPVQTLAPLPLADHSAVPRVPSAPAVVDPETVRAATVPGAAQ